MNKKIFLIIVIFLLGFVLRAQEAFSNNYLFLIDQGRDMMAVKDIVFNHKLTLIGPYTSLQGVFQGPFWYYLLSIPTFIFNGNPWGGIVLMLIISLGVLVVAYLWMRKLFGKEAAVFTLFLLTLSPEAVAAATYTWNPHPMWIIVTLYIFSFFELVGLKNSRFHLLVWPLIALMFHFQTALAVFMLMATFLFLIIFNRKIIIQRHFVYGSLIASIFFLPQVLFELRHDFLMTRSIVNIFYGRDQGLFVGGESKNYLNVFLNNASSFYYNFTTSFVRDGYLKNLPKLALLVMVLFLVLQKKIHFFTVKEWSFMLVITRFVVIIAVLSFFYPFPLRYWFLTGFQSVYLISFGLLLSKFWKLFVGKFAILILSALLLFYSGEKIYRLYFNPPDDGGIAKTKGKIDAIDYIYKDAKGEDFGLLVFAPPVYTYNYDYLIWWYGKRHYAYSPHKEKKGLFYLLIEPDSSKPWSYKGWLETVIKTGNIIETRNLDSGFVVQKRRGN